MPRKAREASNGQLYNARTFIVEGDGRFPLDCLRYDSAWPAEERDSYAIHPAYDDHDMPRRAIMIKTRWPSAPTIDKWKAYGWTVTVVDGTSIAPPTAQTRHRLADPATQSKVYEQGGLQYNDHVR